MATKILPCSCEHEFQDKRYGKKKRLHNKANGNSVAGNSDAWTCTVCGKKKM